MGTMGEYEERVYAGVLGKIIGVYMGRPVEGWSYGRIAAEFGSIGSYVPSPRGWPLVLTDDDIAGTFTLFRALEDSGYDRDISPATIGHGWLNYLVERRTTIWWGGMGNSTEHTAYLRLQAGVDAPESGSMHHNGQVVAEQVGAQIFIDSWAMAAPGDPELAAELARRAASVSHDGEAVIAASFLAALEAQAFVDDQLPGLIAVARGLTPDTSIVAHLVDDVLELRAVEPDWRAARVRLVQAYGEDRYLGNVHIIPQLARMLLGILWGDGRFDRTLSIVVTSGGDTDCNAGNVGCLMGIRGGLAGLGEPSRWRDALADRLYLPSGEGGRAFSDALTEALRIAAAGRALRGEPPVVPKGGARFHFALPGSVQGFMGRATGVEPPKVSNERSHDGRTHVLAVTVDHPDQATAIVATPTFIPLEARSMGGYHLIGSPSLYPGQHITAEVSATPDSVAPVQVRLGIGRYGGDDQIIWVPGPGRELWPGESATIEWVAPETGGQPIAEAGIDVTCSGQGTIHLDSLTWAGSPTARFGRPSDGGTMWRRAWVNGVDDWGQMWPEAYRLSHDRGPGVFTQGGLDWSDYRVDAVIMPRMASGAGLVGRVQGQRRFYSFHLAQGSRALLTRVRDRANTVLADVPQAWESFRSYRLTMELRGPEVIVSVDGVVVAQVMDPVPAGLARGGAGLYCEAGTIACDEFEITAL